jgi:hypothetical protein
MHRLTRHGYTLEGNPQKEGATTTRQTSAPDWMDGLTREALQLHGGDDRHPARLARRGRRHHQDHRGAGAVEAERDAGTR